MANVYTGQSAAAIDTSSGHCMLSGSMPSSFIGADDPSGSKAKKMLTLSVNKQQENSIDVSSRQPPNNGLPITPTDAW